MAELKEIGNPLELNEQADPDGNVSGDVRKKMNVVDLIPVDFNFNTAAIGSNDKDNQSSWAFEYNFEKPIEAFKRRCSEYGLEENSGLRMMITGETSTQEEISNNFTQNKITEALNNLSSYGRFAQALSKGGQAAQAASEAARSTGQAGEGLLSDIGGKASSALKTAGLEEVANTAGSLVLQGKHISLPKIWKSSEYSPSLSLSVDLLSPYGNTESIKKFVVEPLTYLLLLTSPKSIDGVTYGNAPYVYVNAYGITNFNLGYIESLSIRRGGSDSMYNYCKQPLYVHVDVSIRPAVEGFASINKKVSGLDDGTVDMVSQVSDSEQNILGASSTTAAGITTVGNIIKSFRPFQKTCPTSEQTRTSSTSDGGNPNSNEQEISSNDTGDALGGSDTVS